MYYLWIDNNTITGKSDLYQDDVFTATRYQIEVPEEVYNNSEKYIATVNQDNVVEVVLDPDYETKQAEKEAERIGNLKLTKRVFALALQQFGITYAQIKELVATNEQAEMEWDLCVELERKNPLLDTMAAQLNVSPETLDMIFRKANGEDVGDDNNVAE